ncbi:MAG: dipicolinate synthase subunit B [Clostridia bacterium]|nr:dipicolinate synthase subunit B [Clostridia bacterium]
MSAILTGVRIGIALTGSFCTIAGVLAAVEKLKSAGCELYPIMSFNVAGCDTRFFSARALRERVEALCEREVIDSIVKAEPIGPQKLLDIIVVAPCTGNSCAKLANGIADTPVCMACKSQLRNERPVLIGISTNDGLAAAARNIAELLNRKNVFFIPFGQDDPVNKPTSLVTDFTLMQRAVEEALNGIQTQPILINSNRQLHTHK